MPASDKAAEFSFSAKSVGGVLAEKLTIGHHFWSAENYVPLAKAAISRWKLNVPEQKTATDVRLLQRLTSGSLQELLIEVRRVSKDLSLHPLDAELHEQAALILGSFGLREPPHGIPSS